jgi:Ca2+-binding EF-hand superfamily protein
MSEYIRKTNASIFGNCIIDTQMAYNRFNPYEDVFVQADRNRDGVLDRNEFQNFLDFQHADRNHDGRIGFAEFAQVAGKSIIILLYKIHSMDY